jgi:hypothetical protein
MRKAEAELTLELHLNRLALKAGGTATAGVKPADADPERKDRLIKDLSGRFKKL